MFADNFETYTTGSKIVKQAPGADWRTWSNAPGEAKGPIVTDDYANRGNKSVKIAPNNDLVLK